MIYEFSGKRLYALLACLAVLGLLMFAAGVVTGLGLAMPTRQEVALLRAAKPSNAFAAAAPPHVPAAVPALALPALPKPPAIVAVPPAQQPPAAPAATTPAVEPAPNPPAQQAAAAPAPAPAPAAGAVAATNLAQAEEQAAFALQLGSFRDLNHAKQLQTDLKAQGYNTSILTALDSSQREWHIVRIEGFKTLASASQAAAEFIGKERMPAVVRRSKAL
jgi:cell division septation protein DedD